MTYNKWNLFGDIYTGKFIGTCATFVILVLSIIMLNIVNLIAYKD